MAHFTIKNLTFTYPTGGKPALDRVELTVERGEYIAVCGPSGSGKTTLLRHLKPVLTPHGERSGEILYNGVPLETADARTQAAGIGYVMQNPDSQIVTDKVWHELAFGLESLGYDTRTIRLRVAEMSSYFGIQTWFHRDVAELSGGQKQLLSLASIMAMQPDALILDEPTAQLDPIAAADFLNTVRKINLELGTTILITEHRMENVLPSADRVVVMEGGKILVDDSPQRAGEILRRKNHRMFTAMPAPMRIYYAVEGGEQSPITVRDGRSWLTRYMEGSAVGAPATHNFHKEYMEDDENALELREVWFRYEKESPDVLKGVDFQVRDGSFHAVMGGNGTGKSTLLRSICGICRPYRGKVLLKGRRLEKYSPNELFSGLLGMMPQDPQCLFVRKTVREDLWEMLSDRRLPKEQKESLVDEVSKTLELGGLLDSHPYDLSGGEQQRAALGKVLLTEPKLLLLDEPTKGIDAFFKEKLAAVLKKLTEQGVTVLMVSHDVEFCAQYADRISLFFDGGVVTTDTPERFFSGNSFYTTAANRMSRHLFPRAITNEDVITLCRTNKMKP